MSYAGAINPTNKLSRELVSRTRMNQPSLRTIGKWRIEWIESGNDKRMTFQSYKKGKMKQWHKERYLKKKSKR